MRTVDGKLTEELLAHCGDGNISAAEPFPVKSYRELVEHVAKLAYVNKDCLLFFRGQSSDFRNKAGASTFYPSIYRGDYLQRKEVRHRFDVLEGASRILVQEFLDKKLTGASEIRRRKYIQWSILQHYEVCATPLLDFTHSLRVACSFAQMAPSTFSTGITLKPSSSFLEDEVYVFVFGLPYVTNRIAHNSEHELVNIRLLSICPPNALRPHFQDGYLAGTEDILDQYDSKSELDFNRRLIAKFVIPKSEAFWGDDFSAIPASALYPEDDAVLALCGEIRAEADRELKPGVVGDFLKSWAELEHELVEFAPTDRAHPTAREAIRMLFKQGAIDEKLASRFDDARKFRNELVHRPRNVSTSEVEEYLEILQQIHHEFRVRAGNR